MALYSLFLLIFNHTFQFDEKALLHKRHLEIHYTKEDDKVN